MNGMSETRKAIMARLGFAAGEKAEMQKEYVLWGLPKGKTDAIHEQILSTKAKTPAEMDAIKRRAAADGWHSFRVQILDLSKPYKGFGFSRPGAKAEMDKSPMTYEQYLRAWKALKKKYPAGNAVVKPYTQEEYDAWVKRNYGSAKSTNAAIDAGMMDGSVNDVVIRMKDGSRATAKYSRTTGKWTLEGHPDVPAFGKVRDLVDHLTKHGFSRPGAKAAFAADAGAVAKEILRQLGGGRFMSMVGGKNAFHGNFGGKPGLQVDIGKGAEGGINRVIVTLDPATDTYNMEFWRIAKGGLSTKKVSEASGVYADDLQRVFTSRTKFYTSMSRPGAKSTHAASSPVTWDNLFVGHLGNGWTIANKGVTVQGDYEKVANIAYGGAISWAPGFNKSRLDSRAKQYIEKLAAESAQKKSAGQPLAKSGSGQGLYAKDSSKSTHAADGFYGDSEAEAVRHMSAEATAEDIKYGDKIKMATDPAVGKKISKLMDEGYPQKQAIAIALDMKRKGEI